MTTSPRQILFDVNTQVDACFRLTETNNTKLEHWEDLVNDAVKHKKTILGTLGYTSLVSNQKLLLRGTMGWMKVHETCVRKPLLVGDNIVHVEQVVGLFKTEAKSAHGVYFEYPYNIPELLFKNGVPSGWWLQLFLLNPTTQSEFDEFVWGTDPSTLTQPVEITAFGQDKTLPAVVQGLKAYIAASFTNPELVTINQV